MQFLSCLRVCLCVCVTCPGCPGRHLQLRAIKLAQVHQKLERRLKLRGLLNFRKEIFQRFVEFHFPDLKMRDISMAGSSEIWNSSCTNDPSVRKIPTTDLLRQPQSYCLHSHLVSCHFLINCISFPPPHFIFFPLCFFPSPCSPSGSLSSSPPPMGK